MNQGVFWKFDGKLLAVPFDENKYTKGIAKSGNTYNHEKLWDYVKPKDCNKAYNYYPRGRVVINSKGKAIIYMNPNISMEFISDIITAFDLELEPVVKFDYSKHYKCYLD